MTSVSKTFFTVSSCTVAVTKFMDVTWSYITESLHSAKYCGPRTRTRTC